MTSVSITHLERRCKPTPSQAVIFARHYAQSKGIQKQDFRKLVARKALQKRGFDSFLDMVIYQIQKGEIPIPIVGNIGDNVPERDGDEKIPRCASSINLQPNFSSHVNVNEVNENTQDDSMDFEYENQSLPNRSKFVIIPVENDNNEPGHLIDPTDPMDIDHNQPWSIKKDHFRLKTRC